MRTTIRQATPPRLDRRGVLLLAAVCGVAVGNVYFPQAVSPSIAAGLHARPAAAAGIVTATQLGYALGLFALVPLGDRIRHRRLAVSLLVVTGCWLLAARGGAGSGRAARGGDPVGVSTVVAPVIGPMAAGLVAERRRGAVSGALLSGALGGMLLSRALGGPLSQWLGWRAGYLAMALLTLACAALAARTLPTTEPTTSRLTRRCSRSPSPRWRVSRSCAGRASTRPRSSPPSARCGPAWRAADRSGLPPRRLGGGPARAGQRRNHGQHAGGGTLGGPARTRCREPRGDARRRRGGGVLAAGDLGGAGGMAALVAGTLLLDVAMQAGMVANQVRNCRLRPQARSRVNTAYMTCAYGGGAAGSWLGARAFGGFGWLGVCAVAAVLALAAVARHARWRVRSRVSGLSAAARPRQPAAGAVSGHACTVAGMTATTTPGPADAIVARGLIKRFGATTAVDGIDLTIAAGTVFGLLGPNGAGKTTIVNILATLVVPDDGQASVHGYDVITQAHRVRQLIGLTGQYASVDETLTGTENLVLIGRLTGASRKDAKERARNCSRGSG